MKMAKWICDVVMRLIANGDYGLALDFETFEVTGPGV